MSIEVGTAVTWSQDGLTFSGEVVALAPPGHLPSEVMFPIEGAERMEGASVVVRGAPVGPPVPVALYHLRLDGLSPTEAG